MPRNAAERSHHNNSLSFQQALQKSTVFQNDIWPDWQDHINNSNNVVRFVHNGKKKGLEWEDVLPDELRPIWVYHFEMMQEIRMIKFQ